MGGGLRYSQEKVGYFFVLVLVVVSGHPVFSHEDISTFFLVLFLVALTYFTSRESRKLFDGRLVILAVVFLSVFIIQSVHFEFFPVVTYLGVFVRVYIAYLVLSYVKNFPAVYIDVMYRITVLTLPIFIVWEGLRFVGVDIKSFFLFTDFITQEESSINVLIYNFSGKGADHRNSSIFWEPGAYAGYVLIALLLSVWAGLKGEGDGRKLNVLILGLLSSFSTMGYLGLCLYYFIRSVSDVKSSFAVKVGGIFLVIITSVFVFNLPFVGDKIDEKVMQVGDRRDHWEVTRFGNFLFDYEYIVSRPAFGWGPNPQTRYGLHGGDIVRRQGNGFSGSVVKYGMIGFGTYLVLVFYSFRRWSLLVTSGRYLRNLKAMLAVVFIAVTLNSEQFLHYPLYWCLAFVGGRRVGCEDE